MPEIPTQLQATSIQKSINWKRVLIISVIAVVVIGLGVLIFLILQPKPETTSTVTTKKATPSATTATPSTKKDATTDWNVYKDGIISLRYPKKWGRYDTLGTPSFSVEDPTNVSPGVVVPTVLINETPNLSVYGVDLTGLLNAKVGATWDSGAKHYEKLSNLLIDDHKAVWIRQSLNPDIPASGPAIDHIYIQIDTKVYEISLWAKDTDKLSKFTDIFNQILSTFKFLD